MPIVSSYMYILVHGKYGPTSFIIQQAFFSALRVQCVWFILSDSPNKVNHTYTSQRRSKHFESGKAL